MGRIFFIDFDGTITDVDTCFVMVKAFAADGWEEIDRLWQEKELSTKECAERTFKLFNAKPADLELLLNTIEIDPYFKEFVKLAKACGDKIVVLSDGYDFNIRTIFRRYEIDLPFYSNKLSYDGDFHIQCLYSDESCGNCGTCKTSLISKLKDDCDITIYIGDGYSDFCPAKHTDIVFAKNTLLEHCLKNEIKATPYRNFGDIINEMKL
jgi:2,3-diketo-5-methylthio-1-phosphopentane phosphatase